MAWLIESTLLDEKRTRRVPVCRFADVDTAAWYKYFADVDARESSPSYANLAAGVAGDQQLVEQLEQLPARKRQPNLLFASVQFLGGPTSTWNDFQSFVFANWASVSGLMRDRSTQTNEASRCSALLPVLGAIGSPIALIEVGASAGLCLFPDRYSYSYNGKAIGDSALHIEVACTGPVPIPSVLPQVSWRAGVDLNPLDVTNSEDMAWLNACIWPEHDERRDRLERAVQIAAADPPKILSGDINATIDELIDSAPAGLRVVVWHSAVLAYLSIEGRAAFVEDMKCRPDVDWISNEAPGVIADLVTGKPPPSANAFLLGVNGTDVVAYTDPHGSWLDWIGQD